MVCHIPAMAGFKNKMGLTIDSTSKIHKKYLGEPDDLHFVPASPIIERQVLTEQEEGELKRLCALALSHIPHSDDMSDDPLKYIAAAVVVKPPPTAKTASMVAPFPEMPPIPKSAESATPSDTSKRDTMNRTDYSTPLTSAGITPGHRFSDAGKRASSSKGSSNLKFESAQHIKSRTASSSQPMPRKSNDTGFRKSQDAHKASGDYKLTDRTLRIVSDTPRLSELQLPSPENARPARYSTLELNKELPPLPRSTTDPPSQMSIARMLKTIKRKKSQVIEGRSSSVSVSSTPPIPSTETQTPKLRQKSMPAGFVPPELPDFPATTPTKRKFKMPFFSNRKERPQPRHTVTA